MICIDNPIQSKQERMSRHMLLLYAAPQGTSATRLAHKNNT